MSADTEEAIVSDDVHNMPLYKFLHSRDLHYLTVEKTLKISSSSYFRNNFHRMEIKNEFINDPNEGIIYRPQLEEIAGRNPTQSEKEMLRHFGINNSKGGYIGENLIIEKTPDFHMICFAYGELQSLKSAFCTQNNEGIEPYDTCIKFSSSGSLSELISNDSYLYSEDKNNLLEIKPIFSGYVSGPVIYKKYHIRGRKNHLVLILL